MKRWAAPKKKGNSRNKRSSSMSSSRSSLIGDSDKKEPITIRNVSNFGKYFILTPKFETIKEEDEDLEAGSVSAPIDSRSRSEEFNDQKVDLNGEK
jgi:hypothetical protein